MTLACLGAPRRGRRSGLQLVSGGSVVPAHGWVVGGYRLGENSTETAGQAAGGLQTADGHCGCSCFYCCYLGFSPATKQCSLLRWWASVCVLMSTRQLKVCLSRRCCRQREIPPLLLPLVMNSPVSKVGLRSFPVRRVVNARLPLSTAFCPLSVCQQQQRWWRRRRRWWWWRRDPTPSHSPQPPPVACSSRPQEAAAAVADYADSSNIFTRPRITRSVHCRWPYDNVFSSRHPPPFPPAQQMLMTAPDVV